MKLATTDEIVAELKAGRMIILVDEEDRENEGDLLIAADHVTPEAINFMARFGRGLVCLTLSADHCERLKLAPMARQNGTQYGTAFTISIEAAHGVTTGISAADRAHTIRTAIHTDVRAEHLVQPGHVFPIAARPGGVLVRAGHTEAGCDLTALAGLTPAAVICEIMNDDGTMARLPQLIEFAARHGLKIGTIADLIHYRSVNESLVERVGERPLHTPWGPFRAIQYRDTVRASTHLALVRGEPSPDVPVLTRVHECFSLLDLLDAEPSAHSWPLHAALQKIDAAGCGVAVLLDCDMHADAGRGQRNHGTAARKDGRLSGIGSQILRDLGVRRLNVLSSPFRLPALSGHELEIMAFIPLGEADPDNPHAFDPMTAAPLARAYSAARGNTSRGAVASVASLASVHAEPQAASYELQATS
ncbi:bifunctional 3,4-dihydroxy-2-butanone-4-phosphate synthase/GTP cyclohydrolase II [Paraburkholderia bryophila]|uniref:bifunctional 3,4-dihydroxy-2-butanone-4-phosphate synthase/GTP cyclohydrolase II n=1 Tax=Burkholderiaceae TaxID=119060 RepID=UPI0009E0B4F7|nr:bifunctional 3,4-dihydroxy-2-butanone-4-phosphate synthase/GTP cyclohydrolase II [Burkholderia sp. 9120]